MNVFECACRKQEYSPHCPEHGAPFVYADPPLSAELGPLATILPSPHREQMCMIELSANLPIKMEMSPRMAFAVAFYMGMVLSCPTTPGASRDLAEQFFGRLRTMLEGRHVQAILDEARNGKVQS